MASNHFFGGLTFLIRPILLEKNVSIKLLEPNLGSAFGTSSPNYVKYFTKKFYTIKTLVMPYESYDMNYII